MKLIDLFETEWKHSSEFEAHYEKAIKDWMQENVVPRMSKDMNLYYFHSSHDMARKVYMIGMITRKVAKGEGGKVMSVFPSVYWSLIDKGDYEVAIDSVGVGENGQPYVGKTADDFLEEMQLVKMDLSKLHDDPEIAAQLRARMKKESRDEDYSYGDDDRAEEAKRAWRAELFRQTENELKDLKIPPSWVVWYDLDESEDEPYMIVWAVDCGDPEEGGFSDIGDLDDAFGQVNPNQKLPSDYEHMGAYPIDGNSVMFYNVANDLNMPPFDFGQLHSDPEIAKQLRDRMAKKKK